jgi:nitrate reductase NapE component
MISAAALVFCAATLLAAPSAVGHQARSAPVATKASGCEFLGWNWCTFDPAGAKYSHQCVGKKGKLKSLRRYIGGICIHRIRYHVSSPPTLAAAAYGAFGYCVWKQQTLASSYTGVFLNTAVLIPWCNKRRWFWIDVT